MRLEIDWKIASTSSDIFFLRCIFEFPLVSINETVWPEKYFEMQKQFECEPVNMYAALKEGSFEDHRCKIQSVLETRKNREARSKLFLSIDIASFVTH